MPRIQIKEPVRSGKWKKLAELDRNALRRRTERTVWVRAGTIILRVVAPRALCPDDMPRKEPKERVTAGTPGRVILEHHRSKDPTRRSASCTLHEVPDLFLVDGYAIENAANGTVAQVFVLSRTRRSETVAPVVDRMFVDMISREFSDVRIYENPEVRAPDGTQLSERNISVNFLAPVEPGHTLCFVFRPGEPERSA